VIKYSRRTSTSHDLAAIYPPGQIAGQAIRRVLERYRLKPEPAAVTQLEIALDTANEDGIAPFWSVLLTGSSETRPYDSIFDPTSRPSPRATL
jgi:4a-hydroxytetrahydrobiopterin dehydratase